MTICCTAHYAEPVEVIFPLAISRNRVWTTQQVATKKVRCFNLVQKILDSYKHAPDSCTANHVLMCACCGDCAKISWFAQNCHGVRSFCEKSHCNRRNFCTRFFFIYFVLLAEHTKSNSIRKLSTYASVSDTVLALLKLKAYEDSRILECDTFTHTKTSAILVGDRPKCLPLAFGYRDVMRTARPHCITLLGHYTVLLWRISW